MADAEFMSAHEKEKVLKQWARFLASGLKWEKFTKALYEHLHLHCSFIAHYNRQGFYATYFQTGDDIACFLSQFDARNAKYDGVPRGVEYGSTWWVSGDYEDINRAMIEVAAGYIPSLLKRAGNQQRAADLARAMALAQRWGAKVAL